MTPACAPGLPRTHLRLLEYSLQLSPASSRRSSSVAGRPLMRFVRLPSSLGIPNISPPSCHLVRSSPSPQTVSHPSTFGRVNPMTLHVPSSPFLTASTGFSRSKAAGLLHPASDLGVRPVFGDFIPRPAPQCCRLLFSCLTTLCRSPSPFQQVWRIVSRLSPSPRTLSPFEAFPVHTVACSVTCDAPTPMKWGPPRPPVVANRFPDSLLQARFHSSHISHPCPVQSPGWCSAT